MGVTDRPAPSDLIGVYSIHIGSSGAARYAEMVSHGVSEVQRLLARYLTIDKIIPPWFPGPDSEAGLSELDAGNDIWMYRDLRDFTWE